MEKLSRTSTSTDSDTEGRSKPSSELSVASAIRTWGATQPPTAGDIERLERSLKHRKTTPSGRIRAMKRAKPRYPLPPPRPVKAVVKYEEFGESGQEEFGESSGQEEIVESGQEEIVESEIMESGKEESAESGQEELAESGQEELVESGQEEFVESVSGKYQSGGEELMGPGEEEESGPSLKPPMAKGVRGRPKRKLSSIEGQGESETPLSEPIAFSQPEFEHDIPDINIRLRELYETAVPVRAKIISLNPTPENRPLRPKHVAKLIECFKIGCSEAVHPIICLVENRQDLNSVLEGDHSLLTILV